MRVLCKFPMNERMDGWMDGSPLTVEAKVLTRGRYLEAASLTASLAITPAHPLLPLWLLSHPLNAPHMLLHQGRYICGSVLLETLSLGIPQCSNSTLVSSFL